MKKRIPLIFMITLSVLLLLGIIVFTAMIKSIRADEIEADNVIAVEDTNVEGDTTLKIPEGTVIPTPEPSGTISEGEYVEAGTPPETVVIMSGTKKEEDSEYKVVTEDISWTDAQKACKLIKGHLVTIGSKEEFDEIVNLAAQNGLRYVWVGCHRDENGNYVWENNEKIDIDNLNAWGKGEPSYVDAGEAEDYIMLWFMNNKWSFNDSGNDPCKDYPKEYGGKIGYICEFD